MIQNRAIQAVLLLLGIGAIFYVAISLFLPSPRRLIFGIDRQSGDIRLAESGVTFLPPHNYRRVSFVKREGAAQTAGVTQTRSKENVPIKVAYRIRFLVGSSRLPDARRIVLDGWDPWFNDRIGEAVRAFTSEIEVEELIAPISRNNRVREELRQAVAAHLARNGIEVTAFQIESLSIDREALLAYKRQELRRKARAPVGRIVMFGIDGADWDLLDSLISSGRMPNIRSILNEGGAKARVESIQPLVTPLVWASLATGTSPSRHGIVDYFEQTGPQVPVSARSRNAPAIWEIAAAFGRTTLVDDWWTAWPPLRSEPRIVMPDGRTAGLEPSLAERIDELRVPEETIGHAQISRFADVPSSALEEAVSSGDARHPLIILRDILARTWTDHRVGLELYQKTQPMLFMLGFPGADEIHHTFGPFHPPYRGAVDDQLRERYWPVVINYYVELDRLIGEWLQILPEDTTLMIVSAHGHRWDSDRPTTLPFDRPDVTSHEADGVLITFGNRVDPSRSMQSIELLDIAPTILTLLGLPVAEEMPGEFAAALFEDVQPVDSVSISSYSDVVELDRRSVTGGLPDEKRYLAELQRVGHITGRQDTDQRAAETPPDQGPDWGRYAWLNNQGTRLASEGDLDGALEHFESAAELRPNRPVPYLNLVAVALDRQRFSSAEALVWKAIDEAGADPEDLILDLAAWYRSNNMPSQAIEFLGDARKRYPDSYSILSNLGSSLAAAERYTDAIPVLEDALGLRPTSTEVLNNLGTIYAEREDYGRALDYWNRSLEISPRQPKISEATRAAITHL